MPRLPQAVAAVCDHRENPSAVTDRRYRMGPLCMLAILALTFALPIRAAESSEPAPLAAKSLLLDLARAGDRLVAVGDRGHVLLSDDEGRTWRQVIVPTRAMLTGVSFGDTRHGWAVGHDGVILATTDAGESWTLQNSGLDLEAVLLDVLFLDATRGFAVGAYGKCLATTDAGRTWTALAVSEDESHFNAIVAGPGGRLYLPGEAGTLMVTPDGRKWERLEVPYDGSLYGLLPLGEQGLLIYGLRGRVFASADLGTDWAPRDTHPPVLIAAGVRLKSGGVVLAGLGGNFHVSRDDGATFRHWQPTEYTGGVSALLETADSALLVAGEKGVARLTLP
ncbi:hypothetical protein ESB00_11720 [Oleiharenicola lentus]|uniref:Photosynthesis system II assembly factor Ycf48/Hcf136-like domain-containing protein n=1 Tax=Oleiharenicola lentus TaxID=2508720 RepID=A0A4V1M6T3_9BACT|nr:YCF48-related protein [Oleiharenicola lentus]RXK56499.1 hypothetical protein ESB00_11720 [Oleiharenicola lentus]